MPERGDELDSQDAEALLRRIHANAEEAAKIASLRPNGAKMQEILGLYCRLLTAAADYQRHISLPDAVKQGDHDYEKGLWYPASSSPAACDLAWAHTLGHGWKENPIRTNLDLVRRLVAAAVDHLSGAAVLIGTTGLARAPIAASRAGMEACATAAFVIDVKATPIERLRRGLNVSLLEMEEQRRNSDGELKQRIHEEIESIVVAAPSANLAVTWKLDRGFPHIPNAQGKSDATTWMIGELLEQNHDLGASLWRNMSGATHSRDDVTLLLMESWSGYPNSQTRDRDVAFSTIGAVLALTILIPRLADYLGWDMETLTEPSSGLANTWLLASGLYDHELRKHFPD